MKQKKYLVEFQIGRYGSDWGGSQRFNIISNLTTKKLHEAFQIACGNIQINLTDDSRDDCIFRKEEDHMMDDSDFQKLVKLGLNPKSKISKGKRLFQPMYDGAQWLVTSRGYLKMCMVLIKSVNPEFKWRFLPKQEPTFYVGGYGTL